MGDATPGWFEGLVLAADLLVLVCYSIVSKIKYYHGKEQKAFLLANPACHEGKSRNRTWSETI